MRMHIKRWVVALTAMGMVLAAVVPALEAANRVPVQTQPHGGVTDSELAAFAAAYVEVQQILAAHQDEAQDVQEPNKLTALQQEANAKMRRAVEEQGLTVEKYNGIQAVLTVDDELRRKAVDLIEAEQELR